MAFFHPSFMAEQYSFLIFTRSSMDGHLSGFHVLIILACAAVNVGVRVSCEILVLSGCMPRSGLAGP